MTESFAALLDENLGTLDMKPGSIVSGVVLDIDNDWVTVHVGLKSEGIISLDEFRSNEGKVDLLINATGFLSNQKSMPEKKIEDINYAYLKKSFSTNTIGNAFIIKFFAPLMQHKTTSYFISLSARVSSISDNGLGGWYSYRASKAALNQFIRTTAVEYSRSFPNLTCVAIHPGTVRTNFTKKYLGRHPAVSPEDASTNILQLAENLKPESSGQFFDWNKKIVPW